MVIKNKWIPFKGFTAMAIFPFIFVRKDWSESKYTGSEEYQNTIRHEKIHHAQQMEVSLYGLSFVSVYWIRHDFSWWLVLIPLFLFYALYILNWLWHYSRISFEDSSKAYRKICFEQEAYENADNENYLKERFPYFGWIRYIFKRLL